MIVGFLNLSRAFNFYCTPSGNPFMAAAAPLCSTSSLTSFFQGNIHPEMTNFGKLELFNFSLGATLFRVNFCQSFIILGCCKGDRELFKGRAQNVLGKLLPLN